MFSGPSEKSCAFASYKVNCASRLRLLPAILSSSRSTSSESSLLRLTTSFYTEIDFLHTRNQKEENLEGSRRKKKFLLRRHCKELKVVRRKKVCLYHQTGRRKTSFHLENSLPAGRRWKEVRAQFKTAFQGGVQRVPQIGSHLIFVDGEGGIMDSVTKISGGRG